MNKLLIWFAAAGLAHGALAQDAEDAAGARERIARERGEVEAVYKAGEQACYRKFAVNDCLKEARSRRREAMADLKRQETSLSDAERRRKGAQRQRAIEERAQAERRMPPTDPTAPVASQGGHRTPSGPTIEEQQAAKAQAQERNAADAAARQREKADRQREKEADAARRKEDAAKNADRRKKAQAEAQQHRESVKKRLAEGAGSRAQPLPAPP